MRTGSRRVLVQYSVEGIKPGMELTAKVTGGALAAAAVGRRRLGRSLGFRV